MAQDSFGYTEGVGTHIAAHSFYEEGEKRLVERVAPGTGVVEMPATPQISGETTGAFPSGEFVSCRGKSRFVIQSMFQFQGESAEFRLKLFDTNSGEIGYTQALAVDELGMPAAPSGRYHGTLYAVSNEFGAAGIQAQITSAPSGELQIAIGML